MNKIVILGAGIAGISAAYHLKQAGFDSIILEKESEWGGLCNNFTVGGFRFDRFIHLSFTNNEYVKALFDKVSHHKHVPNPYNYYSGTWLKHPAQNNLFPLSDNEKTKIIEDFKSREETDISDIHNYEEWLRVQYGNYFAEHFPMEYTKKYWCKSASELEIKWVGSRMYKPSLDEVIQGAETSVTPVTYYAKEMRYPEIGGYKSFIEQFVDGLHIECNKSVVSVDSSSKSILCKDGSQYSYDYLLSSIPIPAFIPILSNVSLEALEALEKLRWTGGYLISIGLKTTEIPPHLWFYIYDKEILPARIYSPSLKSEDNAPSGCSSLQAEVYFANDSKIAMSQDELLDSVINSMVNMEIIKREDILVSHIKKEPFANIIFDHEIYKNRTLIQNELLEKEVHTIGRFGKWDYFWSDQSFLSGKSEAEVIIDLISKKPFQ